MSGALADERPSVAMAGFHGPRSRIRNAFSRFENALLGPTEGDAQHQDVIRRALVALVVIAVLPIQHSRLPGWQGVVFACAAALVSDIFFAYMVFVKKRYLLERVLGTIGDSVILMSASFYVFHKMGAAGSSSDIWLVFLVYIITGGFSFEPLGSVLYTALWVMWFAAGTLLFFPVHSQFQEQLPIRLVFFCTIGLTAAAISSELRNRRAKLAQQSRQTMGMLAKLVEARDTDAGAHLRGIQHYSRALALRIGMSEREADEIAYASMVHDVGKANVPDAILKKPGRLSSDEWRTMKEHTKWGDELLNESSDFETARQVARWHHEHWDGSGYPDGLAREDIPLPARIVAVADVYDALISKRPYKGAWPAEEAIAEIQRLAGSHLDPDIVQAFLDLWHTGIIRLISEQIGKHSDEDVEAQAA
jgi:hypothetical protein